jgi:acetyltransferase-like isoleucine patch superfamily enzyme
MNVMRKSPRRLEKLLPGIKNRLLQRLAMAMPGAMGLRVALHRLRGVRIGKDVWIGYESLIETGYPSMVSIGDRVIIGIRSTILAHFDDPKAVTIKDDVFIGPCALILPGVTIGEGAVVTAGSVVSCSVPRMTMVQGNPASPVARCGIPLGLTTPYKKFLSHLRPLPTNS